MMEQIQNYQETMKAAISSNPLFFVTFFVISTAIQSLAIHKSAKSTGATSTFLKGLSAFILAALIGTIVVWIMWIAEAQLDIVIPTYINYISGLVMYGLVIKFIFKVSFGHALIIWLFSLILLFVWFIVFAIIFFLGTMIYWRIS